MIGAETITLGPSEGLPSRDAGTKMPWKGIGTRVQINGGGSSAYISATFDNVYKNGALYDTFSSPTIDSAKWTNYEFVREISEGKLRSKSRSSSTSTNSISNRLEFLFPSSIDIIKAKVTPITYQNDQGIDPLSAYLGGIYYNDGTPGGGFIGDVIVGVGIGRSGVSPEAGWRLSRFTDAVGQNVETVATGVFTTSISIGVTYDLLIRWDGSKFIFRINDEVAQYTPATTINPPNNIRREIGTSIRNPGGKEGTIEALFDDVVINDFNDFLVDHYYTSILGRTPDPGGKVYWESEVERTQTLGIDIKEAYMVMSGNFFTWPEYLGFGRTDEEFLTDLYLTFFDRAPDSGGLSYWLSELSSGSNRDMVMYFFMFSTEFYDFMSDLFGDTTTRAEIYPVVDFYRGFLSRLPDDGGFAYWLNRFRAAQCIGSAAITAEVDAISSLFLGSAEYVGRGRTNAQFVRDCYYAFMRRYATASEVNWWVNELNTSARDREQVRRDFIATQEFQGRVTAMIAQGCLSP